MGNFADGSAFMVFFLFWMSLGIGGAVFYYTASYKAKKKWHPFFVIGSGAIFFVFLELSTHGQIPILFPIGVVLITWLNLRNTRFCPKCDKTLYARGWSRDKFCPKCGADLDEEIPRDGTPIS